MDIKILVASHKKAEMPEDSMYLPVHVGRVLYPDREFGYQSVMHEKGKHGYDNQ